MKVTRCVATHLIIESNRVFVRNTTNTYSQSSASARVVCMTEVEVQMESEQKNNGLKYSLIH